MENYLVDQLFGDFPKLIRQRAKQTVIGTVLTVVSTARLEVGYSVNGYGIPQNTTIVSIAHPKTITISSSSTSIINGILEFVPSAGSSNVFDIFAGGYSSSIISSGAWEATEDSTAIKNVSIPDDGISYFEFTVTGPTNITFDWKISCESECDFGTFYVNGTEEASIDGDVYWHTVNFNINQTGPVTLKWEYSKDGSVTEGDDAVYLRNLVIGAYIPPSWEELPLATMPWNQGLWNGTVVVTGMPGQILSDIYPSNTTLINKIKDATKIKVTYNSPRPITLAVGSYGTATSYNLGTIQSGVVYTMPTSDSFYNGYRLDFREEVNWSAFSISKIEIINDEIIEPELTWINAFSTSNWTINTGSYVNGAYKPPTTSGWDSNYGIGWMDLRVLGTWANGKVFKKVRIGAEFEINDHNFFPAGDNITVKLTGTPSYATKLNTESSIGVQKGNVFEFTFDMGGEALFQMLINSENASRITSIEFGY